MITKAVQLEILERAVKSALVGSHDADTATYTTNEKFQLNEQWCQSYIGFAINDYLRSKFRVRASRNAGCFVTFETSAGWLKDFANFGSSIQGRPPAGLAIRGRYDLAVWDDNNRPSGVVEVKDTSALPFTAIAKDCNKIVAAIDKLHTVKWGIFLFNVRASARKSDDMISAHLTEKSTNKTELIRRKYPGHFSSHFRSEVEHIDQCRIMWTGVLLQNRRSTDG